MTRRRVIDSASLLDEPSDRRLMSIQIDHMCPLIQVFSMRRSLAFYRDTLGFSVVRDSGNGDDSSWVWLRLGDCHLMLNDQYEPGHEPPEPPAERTKWHQDTCLYLGSKDPDSVYRELLSKGLDLAPPKVAPYGMKQLTLSDPDNYQICFQCPATPVADEQV